MNAHDDDDATRDPSARDAIGGGDVANPPDLNCQMCKGTGCCDSGGTMPWGAAIEVRCDCTYKQLQPTQQGELLL